MLEFRVSRPMQDESFGRSDDTRLVENYLTQLKDGRELDAKELSNVVYEDLRKLAHHLFVNEPSNLTIQPTALVHEAYLRLADQRVDAWENRAHFMAVAALAMRRVLATGARERRSLKRGGAMNRVSLLEHPLVGSRADCEILDLEEALDALAEMRPRYARVAEFRLFSELTIAEIAQLLGGLEDRDRPRVGQGAGLPRDAVGAERRRGGLSSARNGESPGSREDARAG